MLSKVRDTIEKNNLLQYGDTVICAVSGGADSICLLHVLLSLAREYNLTIFTANVNHLIRAEESDADSEFVRAVSRAADVKCFYREYDVPKISRERKIGEEECGRILRYEFFEELSASLGGAKIATAHNLNDNAETVLFRLARGSAAKGLSGIKYKRKNIIRPLLDVSREEIEKYLRSNSITWREDSTNSLPIYARNKIRLSVLPCLEEISSGSVKNIVSAAKLICEDDVFITECAQKSARECFFGTYLIAEKFSSLPMPIKRRVAAYVLKKWHTTEITAEKTESFCSLFEKENGCKFDINGTFFAQKEYDRITLCKKEDKEEFSFLLEEDRPISHKNFTLSAKTVFSPIKRKSNNVAIFDADKVSLPFVVRGRKDGDKIALAGMSGRKKLSDLFTDEKIKRQERDGVPVVEKDGEILFVCGLRQTKLYSPDENTKKLIVIKYEKKN